MKYVQVLISFFLIMGQLCAQSQEKAIVYVLDGSGSMWGKMQKTTKIAIAKDVMKQLSMEHTSNERIGLVAYGHRTKGDCEDVEYLIRPQSHTHATFAAEIDKINPTGMTPLAKAAKMLIDDLSETNEDATVILITDGIETCDGKLCDLVKEARNKGINFVLHIIGFDLGKEDRSELECAARATGGLYLEADNADQLAEALKQSKELKVDKISPSLSVKAMKDGELVDLGKCSASAGEAYSMANYQGRIYISAYPGARISVYDPDKPYDFGNEIENNPRDLGRIDEISYRPRSTLAGPLGRIWVASLPDYGMWGGPLSYYDPANNEKKAYYRIFGDGSCYALAHLEDQELIAVGTSISGGSGTQPKMDEAVLFLWDYHAEKKVWTGTLDHKVAAFNALLTGPDGRLYGTATGKESKPVLFVFDPKSFEIVAQIAVPEGRPLDLGLQNGSDGNIYGFTRSCIYRVDPDSLTVKMMARDDEGFSVAGPILGEDIYFATGHRLRAATILER